MFPTAKASVTHWERGHQGKKVCPYRLGYEKTAWGRLGSYWGLVDWKLFFLRVLLYTGVWHLVDPGEISQTYWELFHPFFRLTKKTQPTTPNKPTTSNVTSEPLLGALSSSTNIQPRLHIALVLPLSIAFSNHA